MEEDVKNFILVWLSAIISVSYCYYVSPKIKAGLPRLLSVLPVCALFLVLPLFLSSTIFCSHTAFYLSVASLKLIQFSYEQGPLFPLPQNLSHFISLTCLPIKLQQNPKSINHFPKWFFAVKVGIFGVLLHVYDYIQYLPSILLLGLYPLHVYLEHEILLTLLKSLVTITLGCDLEPQFNEPYLATSLQDFWGRRWNLTVTAILRSSVYSPVRRICGHLVNSERAMIIGVLATFLVSGVAHEVLFIFVTRDPPTGEVTWFFVLHGVCTVVEVLVKKNFLGRWRVRPVVSRLVTVGFVCLTGGWLFFPQLKRSSVMERRANETLLFVDFFKPKFLLP
ncbi:probable long-chain-alcohol O-fatty-acyltransferase 4 [Arabidopsis lyrata subsp. lyrata]|uniref:probable long-chain-alcohol O-fatty-acyltransferase 4 n=1 Tax=Arabidopsis lyrata subsp. lyrata TaxID=81972 RepID=UPI000A29E57C|nr:probable long-chain-alcohol O-fatty-acyltransferase 4 [Arabidopsis lyrata subsp. lyrata]|eukprot:XP_020881826.1 probable long-chain-alcohol O-fatty-acyltransferase 4 [Arabidopsis lyrata subsp. lyrata]